MAASIDVRNKLARFLDCELDCNSGQLRVSGTPQKLEPLVHQFLLLLIQNQGKVVSKQKVLDTLWVNKNPTDETLRALIKKAREALKDDARKPTYIKTLPTKGYLLIPVVELSSTLIPSLFAGRTKVIIFSLAVIFLVTITSGVYFYLTDKAESERKSVVLMKTKIGLINKNKVSTHYVNESLKNMWIEDVDGENYSQVQLVDINSKFQQKIVFTVPLSKQMWFSSGSQRLLVMRNDRAGFFSIQFNKKLREPNIIEYKMNLAEDSIIKALDYNGNHIFVISSNTQTLHFIDIESGKPSQSKAIDKVQEEFEEAKDLFLASEDENASMNVWPSPSSDGFVVAFAFKEKTRLSYYSSMSASLADHRIDITGTIQSAVWNADGGRFSFTNDNSNLFAYQVKAGRLTSFNANGEPVNQVVADCGTSCFVVANTQGIPKLSEITNPFFSFVDNSGSEQNNLPYAQIVDTNMIPRNEYLPSYNQQGLYFISQQFGKTEVIFRDNKDNEKVVFQFEKRANVQELTVDATDNYLAGVLNQRPFLLNLSTQEFSYLPLTFPQVSHIDFSLDNKINFYAQLNANQSFDEISGKTQARNIARSNPGQANGLYQYDMKTRQVKLLQRDLKRALAIELIDLTEKGSNRYNAILSQKNNGQISVTFQNNRQATVFELGMNDCANCWHIQGNYFYQIEEINNKAYSSSIKRTNLLTGEQSRQALLFSDVLNTFSIQPDSNKIMVTTRQNLQTELTKIEGFAQVY